MTAPTIPIDAETAIPAGDDPHADLDGATRNRASHGPADAPRSSALLQLVFLLGLSGVFLANAVVAVVEPAGFEELVAASPLGGLLDGAGWIAPVIAGNDFMSGSAVSASHHVQRLRAPVLAWAGGWLLIVTVIKLITVA